MSTVARLQYKAMMDSWGAFDTAVKLAENALASNKIKKFASLKQLVHENYFKFDKDFRNYKADVIEKQAKTEANFNGSSVEEQTGENIANYQYNDAWAVIQMGRYSDTTENLDDGLESTQSNVLNKYGQSSTTLLITVANAEFASLENLIKKLKDNIEGLADLSIFV